MARARRAVNRSLSELPATPDGSPPLVLVACSGGPDSLALAAAAAHWARRGTVRLGAAVIDHQMQPGSHEVAGATVRVLQDMGLEPVISRRVTVDRAGYGPEMAARVARYAALNDIAAQLHAEAVLLGHTRNDQAETVLLGLARGSGTRSLSGMSSRHTREGVLYLRPFLNVTRQETETICRAEGLDPWHDPSNSDTALMRSRIRRRVLPFLEEHLGPGISDALARTASVLEADADFLDEQAAEFFRRARVEPAAASAVELDCQAVQEAPAAMRRRMLAQACIAAGGETPTFERLSALEGFALGHGAAGPLQMAGKVTVWRRRADPFCAKGRLEFQNT
ncbi:tRNA lysidine(34) synthetase TilS [Kocuria sp. cx-455]|uniref:tRNA lysidine(34) synthetase TilS n=1 Tax=Kocuria sp. cx-455 TaxID=2771377 RepID=UPI002803BC39|nr:tRNA lysidine(34) synthetase TilS [Kocuria sp. cx-455]